MIVIYFIFIFFFCIFLSSSSFQVFFSISFKCAHLFATLLTPHTYSKYSLDKAITFVSENLLHCKRIDFFLLFISYIFEFRLMFLYLLFCFGFMFSALQNCKTALFATQKFKTTKKNHKILDFVNEQNKKYVRVFIVRTISNWNYFSFCFIIINNE